MCKRTIERCGTCKREISGKIVHTLCHNKRQHQLTRKERTVDEIVDCELEKTIQFADHHVCSKCRVVVSKDIDQAMNEFMPMPQGRLGSPVYGRSGSPLSNTTARLPSPQRLPRPKVIKAPLGLLGRSSSPRPFASPSLCDPSRRNRSISPLVIAKPVIQDPPYHPRTPPRRSPTWPESPPKTTAKSTMLAYKKSQSEARPPGFFPPWPA